LLSPSFGCGGGGFDSKFQVSPVADDMTISFNGESKMPSNAIVTYVKSFESYTDALNDNGVEVSITKAGQSIFSRTVKAGVCMNDGTTWDYELLYISIDDGTPKIAGYECKDGDRYVNGVLN
jgi:hypothetical protein